MSSHASQQGSRTVAVVDDDPMVGLVVTRILEHAGCTVQRYDSGEALLAASPLPRIDLICLDLSLPGIDGLETLTRLKHAGVATPVIIFTASADEVSERALAAGAFACVSKTAGWDELRAAVNAALAGRS